MDTEIVRVYIGQRSIHWLPASIPQINCPVLVVIPHLMLKHERLFAFGLQQRREVGQDICLYCHSRGQIRDFVNGKRTELGLARLHKFVHYELR